MKYRPGESGNPAGRPRGSADRRSQLRAALDGKADELLQKATDMALAGDPSMLALLINRVIPATKPESAPMNVALPEGSLSDKAGALVDAAANGEVPTSSAAELLSGMAVVAKLRELDELEARLKALEARSGGGQ